MGEKYRLFDDGVLGHFAVPAEGEEPRPAARAEQQQLARHEPRSLSRSKVVAEVDFGTCDDSTKPTDDSEFVGDLNLSDDDDDGGEGGDDHSASSSDSAQTGMSYIQGVKAHRASERSSKRRAAGAVAAIPEDEEESATSSIRQKPGRRRARKGNLRDGSMVPVGLPGETAAEGGAGTAAARELPTPPVDLMLMLNEAVSGLEAVRGTPHSSVVADEDDDEDGGENAAGVRARARRLLEESDGRSRSRTPSRRASSDVSTEEGASPPSHRFGSYVQAKSREVLGSFRPTSVGSSGRRHGGGGFPYWRRGRSSATAEAEAGNAEAGDAEAARDEPLRSRFEIVEGLGASAKIEIRTVATENDEEEGNHLSSLTNNNPSSNPTGWITKDTYSFLYVFPLASAPFVYAMCLFAFQSLVYFLLLSSLIDTDNPGNMLNVPPVATTTMRLAQGCAILIAVVNGADVMVAMNNLLRVPEAIVVTNSGPTYGGLEEMVFTVGRSFRAGRRFKFANGLRLVEGCLAVAAAFILIVRAGDVIELFMNFAALEFVVNLDNVAFALAEHGLVTDRLRDAARFVGGLGFSFDDDRDDGNHRRAAKGNRGGGSCADSAGRISQLKGSFLARLFGMPVRVVKRHPDSTRRTILFVMAAVLFGCWAWILSGLDASDAFPKSLDVEFFHSNIPESTAHEASNDVKHFLVSRSGTYIATIGALAGGSDESFLGRLSKLVSGRSGQSPSYRKADPRAEPPLDTERVTLEFSRTPTRYEDFIFYDATLRRWVFASCAPYSISKPERVCTWPRIHSVETDELDLTALSDAAFRIAEEDPHPYDASMTLPARIASTECAPPAGAGQQSSMETNELKCGLFGGVCSDPMRDVGFARLCLCPPGQYGVFCTDQYGASCPTLHIVRHNDVVEPPGAARFEPWEERRPFELVKDERGVGNTPIWTRTVHIKGYTDRIEWRGGTHWTITREEEELGESHTYAIAEGASGGVANSAAMHAQPPPAGLTFRAPKKEAWGTRPDFYRPFAAYKLECKPA
ncbi:hypothetical protein ACHAXT_013246 [Thalassiosira profunda]